MIRRIGWVGAGIGCFAVVLAMANGCGGSSPASLGVGDTEEDAGGGSRSTLTDAGSADSGASATHHDAGTRGGFSQVDGGDASVGAGSGSGTGTDNCGICDREWQCDASRDEWVSVGTNACFNATRNVTLFCDGTIAGGGTWSGDASKLTLVFPEGSSTFAVTCTP